MSRFRKKPVVIEAYQWTYEDAHVQCLAPDGTGLTDWTQWPQWLRDASKRSPNEPGALFRAPKAECWTIRTLEGDHNVREGDFIIKGVAGELYPCKPDIFAQTYEEAT